MVGWSFLSVTIVAVLAWPFYATTRLVIKIGAKLLMSACFCIVAKGYNCVQHRLLCRKLTQSLPNPISILNAEHENAFSWRPVSSRPTKLLKHGFDAGGYGV